MATAHVNRLSPIVPAATNGTAITKRSSIEPESLDEIITFASIAMKSQYFGVRNIEEAAVRILYGREMGLTVMQSMMGISIIQGRPGMSAGTVAAKVKESGKYDYKVVKWDEKICELQFTEYGKPVGKSVFTLEDAKRAGIFKAGGGWDKYPRAMLFARACTQGVRAYAPDIFLGPIYTPEELEDGSDMDVQTLERQAEVYEPEIAQVAEVETTKKKVRPAPITIASVIEPEPVIDVPFDDPEPDGPIVPLVRTPAAPFRSQVQPSAKGELVAQIDKWLANAEIEFEKRGYPDMMAPGRTVQEIYLKLAAEQLVSGEANSYRPRVVEIAKIADNWEALREYLRAAGKAVEADLLGPPQ